jgi:membrane protease YdiL (CAAX protease family)
MRYTQRPCYPELVAVVCAGLLHIVTEIALSEMVARAYNVLAAVGFLVYVIWRARATHGALRTWGICRDNFWPALRAQLGFGAVATLAIVAYGLTVRSLSLPWTFWMTVALYPAWGIAQQFALQNLIARNLTGVLSHPVAIAGASAAIFAFAHYPRVDLLLLALVAGFFFTLIYRRVPNLWAVGIVHGVLGSLAVYVVLNEDPGATLWSMLLGP